MFIKFTNPHEDREIYDLKWNAKNLQNLTMLESPGWGMASQVISQFQ